MTPDTRIWLGQPFFARHRRLLSQHLAQSGIVQVPSPICLRLSGVMTSGDPFVFFQAEDGIRDLYVTGVQTCALPIFTAPGRRAGPQSQSASPRLER